jgi:GT2 family glycosyltransferase
MSGKIGLAIITHKRPEYFKRSFATVPMDVIDDFIVVNDGTPYDFEIVNLIQNAIPLGVGASKNIAFRHLLENRNDHIFIMEDDILIEGASVFNQYIHVSQTSGIQHLNFSQHGLMNKKTIDGTPNPRATIDCGNSARVALYPHCVGAFSYYTRRVLEQVGLIDERFYNAFDHVEHTYRIIKAGFHPDFWWFADVANSHELLSDILWTKETSTISSRSDHASLVGNAFKHFQAIHNLVPTQIPDSSFEAVYENLKRIFTSKLINIPAREA